MRQPLPAEDGAGVAMAIAPAVRPSISSIETDRPLGPCWDHGGVTERRDAGGVDITADGRGLPGATGISRAVAVGGVFRCGDLDEDAVSVLVAERATAGRSSSAGKSRTGVFSASPSRAVGAGATAAAGGAQDELRY